jgi:cobalt/nickel transport protein
MKRKIWVWMIIVSVLGMAGSAFGYFGMVIPSDNMVMQNDKRSVNLKLSFNHPMEMVGMELVKPKFFSVWANGKKLDLLDSIKPNQVMDHKAWQLDYQIKRPGIYIFYMGPQP